MSVGTRQAGYARGVGWSPRPWRDLPVDNLILGIWGPQALRTVPAVREAWPSADRRLVRQESLSPWAFDEDAVRRAGVLADHATVAIDAAANADRADNLEIALQRNRVTGTAVGILVERLRLTPTQAFDLLRVMSQHTNRKLADLAEHLVETGELPGVDDLPRG